MEQPIYTYPHGSKRACIVGGFVYRGTLLPFAGHYFFADYVRGAVSYLELNSDGSVKSEQAFDTLPQPIALTQGAAGSIFLSTLGGQIYRYYSDVGTTTKTTTTTNTPLPGASSCEGRCTLGYDPAQPCQCDDGCVGVSHRIGGGESKRADEIEERKHAGLYQQWYKIRVAQIPPGRLTHSRISPLFFLWNNLFRLVIAALTATQRALIRRLRQQHRHQPPVSPQYRQSRVVWIAAMLPTIAPSHATATAFVLRCVRITQYPFPQVLVAGSIRSDGG